MKVIFFAFVFSFSLILSCFQTSNISTKIASLYSEITQSNEDYIIGEWFVPHSAFITITFKKDNTFVFIDFNSKKLKEERLIGKYKINGKKLTLIYNDRPSQDFLYYKGKNGDTNYYIKKKGYYFVKSDE